MQGRRGRNGRKSEQKNSSQFVAGHGSKAPSSQMHAECDDCVLRHSASALSGTLTGFVLGGAIELSVATFVAVVVGGGLEWMMQGLVL